MSALRDLSKSPLHDIPGLELEGMEQGQHLLIDTGNRIVLLKYERHENRVVDGDTYRLNRQNSIIDGSILMKGYVRPPASERVIEKLDAYVYGSHSLTFRLDEEFGIYLPSSDYHSDSYLTFARRFADGSIRDCRERVTIVSEPSEIEERLRAVSHPYYFEHAIVPFLEGREAGYNVPTGEPPPTERRWWQFKKPSPVLDTLEAYRCVARTLSDGDFVYIGSKAQVCLLGVAKTSGALWMQGTYVPSTKPIMLFSNTHLGYSSPDKPGTVLGSRPFVFPSIVRSQDAGKYNILHSYPELVTGNLEEALEHFRTTDFAEFADLVNRFAGSMDVIHPSFHSHGSCFI